MSLEYAILGFLSYHTYSGYDLKKIFDTSVRHFWQADQSQIYRTLAQLTAEGLVEMEKIEQTDRPDRKVYTITTNGRAELRRWLIGPPPLDAPRSAPLVQVFFAGQLPDAEILEKFEGFASIIRGMLEQYERVPAHASPYIQEINSPRETFFWMLTLDNGIRNMRANLEWAESVIDRIRKGEIPTE